MARYVDKDKLIKELSAIQNRPVNTAMKIIAELPTEKVQPIVLGKWIEFDETIQCSNCGTVYTKHDNSIQYKRYCERCGAKMENAEE